MGQKKSACGKLPTEENGLVPEDRRPDKNSNKNQGKRGGGTHDLAILRSESHENCFVRINFSRRIILKPLKKYLVTKKETLTFYEKSPLFFAEKTAKKHQNRHEMVIHGSKSDVDHTKMIRKTRSTKPRSSYCAKTLKMRV